MSNLPQKIHSATQDLQVLQKEIQSPLPAAGPRLAEIDPASLKEFKLAIDYVRQLLWTYIQADGRTHGQNIDEQVRSLRLQHVTEMLHAIQQEAKLRQITPSSATVSFLNAVQEIADAAFHKLSAIDSDTEKAS